MPPIEIDHSDNDRYVFLTDGASFLGPYLPGDIAISRGQRTLKAEGATEVHAVRAKDLDTARAAWATVQAKLHPAPTKQAPAKQAAPKKAGGKRD